jgi:hypothetical protein
MRPKRMPDGPEGAQALVGIATVQDGEQRNFHSTGATYGRSTSEPMTQCCERCYSQNLQSHHSLCNPQYHGIDDSTPAYTDWRFCMIWVIAGDNDTLVGALGSQGTERRTQRF